MVANINFLAGPAGFPIQDLSGSGLGWYGSAGFGASVAVGAFASRCYITDGNGLNQGPEVEAPQFLNSASGILLGSTSGINLRSIPAFKSSLDIRFTYDTAVRVQNTLLRIHQRAESTNNNPSGVTCMGAEIIHPDPVAVNNGSGSVVWTSLGGSGSILTLAACPGPSGLNAGNGTNSTFASTQHDWFVCLSPSPLVIGSRLFSLFVQTEYL